MNLPEPSELVSRLILWGKVWSQLVSDEDRTGAWRALQLPASFPQMSEHYWPAFHVGMPGPSVSLLFHAALGLDGANCREDWMRVANYLGMQATENRLPPDHLGSACEIFAIALDQGEPMLVRELSGRYLLPWCAVAESKLAQDFPALKDLPDLFKGDVLLVRESF